MSPRRVAAAAALLLALGLAACGDDEGGAGADAPGADAMDVDAPPSVTFTTFVIDLVANQTAGTTDPRPYADFATLPDPDRDDPSAYSSLFP